MIFGFSLILNIYLIALSGLGGSSAGRSTTIVEGDWREKIAVIPITGTIMERNAEQFDRRMTAVEKDPYIKAIVLEIDTPGGSVSASDEIHHRLARFKKEHNIPIVVAQGGLATSGGYYVSCGADYIFAQPTTLTGNIGVLMPRFNLSKLMDKWGIEETTIASTGATFKNAGSMFKPEKPEETAYIQSLADSAFVQFKKVIADGRTGKLKEKVDVLANGKVYTAPEAVKLGLIDQIGYAPDAYNWAQTKAGLKNPEVVRFQESPSLLELFTGESHTPQGGVTINGINIVADKDALTELTTPRMMYLWRGE